MFGGRSFFASRTIAPARFAPATMVNQVHQYIKEAAGNAKSALQPTLSAVEDAVRGWGWEEVFVLALCLLYVSYASWTVLRARRARRTRLRDVRTMSLEELRTELQALLDEGRAEGTRIAQRNKYSMAGVDAVPAAGGAGVEMQDAECDGDSRLWHWRTFRDQILRQRLS